MEILENAGMTETRDYAALLGNLADSFHQLGKHKGAEQLYSRGLRVLERVTGPRSTQVAAMRLKQAAVYAAQRRSTEAEAVRRTWTPLLEDQHRARVSERLSPKARSFLESR
jgi:hypothetical protein